MSRTEDDETITVGAPFPKFAAVSALEGFNVRVTWKGGDQTSVDLAPNILAFKVYAPLRNDRALFQSVHVVGGAVIAWGEDDAIDMHVSEVERLANETMEAVDFRGFLTDMDVTWDGAAALLGISRRMVGYYAKSSVIPRNIAMACAHLLASRASRLPGE